MTPTEPAYRREWGKSWSVRSAGRDMFVVRRLLVIGR